MNIVCETLSIADHSLVFRYDLMPTNRFALDQWRRLAILDQVKRKTNQDDITVFDLNSIGKGNRSAQLKVYNSYVSLLYFICRRYNLSDQVADDVVQDTFVKLFTNTPNFTNVKSLKSWLATVCRNACIDSHRSQVRLDPIDSHEQLTSLDAQSESKRREDEFQLAAEFINEIAGEPGGDTFIKFYRDGKTAREIANEQSEAISTVTTRLSRLRKKFGEILKERLEQLDQYGSNS